MIFSSLQIKILYLPKQSDPKLFVQLNTEQDVIKIKQIIKEQDIVAASASRKIVASGKTSARISFLAKIEVEKIELLKDEQNVIKITGQLIEASDDNVQLHQSQTLLLDRTSKVTIYKQDAADFDLKILEEQTQTNQFALCIICQSYAKFSCQCSDTYTYVNTIQYKQVTKTLYNADKLIQNQEKNWSKTFKLLQDDIIKYKPTKLFIVANNMIFSQLKQSKIFIDFLQQNKTIDIDQSYQLTDTNFGRVFQYIAQNNLDQQIQRFKKSMVSEDHQSAIGVDAEQILKTQINAVEVVMISENVLGFDKTQEIINLVKQNQQISLLYTTADQDAEDYIKTMTGLIILLKYPVYSYEEQNQKVGQPYTDEDWKVFKDI